MLRCRDFLGRLDFSGQWLLAHYNNSIFRPYLRLLVLLLGIKYLIWNGRPALHRVLGEVPRLPLRPLRMKAVCLRYRKVIDYTDVREGLSKGSILLLSSLAFIGMWNGYHYLLSWVWLTPWWVKPWLKLWVLSPNGIMRLACDMVDRVELPGADQSCITGFIWQRLSLGLKVRSLVP